MYSVDHVFNIWHILYGNLCLQGEREYFIPLPMAPMHTSGSFNLSSISTIMIMTYIHTHVAGSGKIYMHTVDGLIRKHYTLICISMESAFTRIKEMFLELPLPEA